MKKLSVPKTIIKIWNIAFDIIFYVILALVTGAVILHLCGWRLYSVTTGSMSPTYPIGSMLIVRPTDFSELQTGDVITYNISETTVVTHRIYSIDADKQTVITKGDANQTSDSYDVNAQNIIGKVVFSVPYLGFATTILSTQKGMFFLLGIAAALFIFSIGRRLYNSTIDQNEKNPS